MDRGRELSVQRRAKSAVKAEKAASCADDMMQQLLDESRGENRETGAERGTRSSSGTGGGLLDALGPVGPPLTFSPMEPPRLVDSVEGKKTSGVSRDEKETPGVKKVVVAEPTSDPQRFEGRHRPQVGSVSETVTEHGFREGTGKGRGSGSEGRRVITRTADNPEMFREMRNPRETTQGTNDPAVRSSQKECERFFIGEGSPGLKPPGLDQGLGSSVKVGDVVNPFWSHERQQEALNEVYGSSMDYGSLGRFQGSNSSTPQKVGFPGTDVELDPVELFRLRCLREAEEKFRQGLADMVGEKGSYESTSSYMTVGETSDNFIPKPPPGPPPPSPPKLPISWEKTTQEKGVTTLNVPPFPPSCSGPMQNLGMIGESASESLRTVELPHLSADSTALQYGDWLSIIDSTMGDLSYSSSEWWAYVREGVDRCYADWLKAGSLERLRLKPEIDPKVKFWPRTERRGLSMLLGAIPENIRDELVATRKLSTDQVLYKLCVTFQPGGAIERTKLLQCITDSRCGTGLADVLDWIRLWRRYVQRTRELGVTLPDGLVLIGALSKCTDFLSSKSPQVAYRLNLIRQQLNLDQLPTVETILTFAEHLQAEAEDMMISSGTKATSAVRVAAFGAADPIGNGETAKETNQTTPKPKGSCRFWMSDKGCLRGSACKFQHPSLDPQSNRCFECSAVGHTRRECPVKTGDGFGKGNKNKVAKSSKSKGKGNSDGVGKGGKTGNDKMTEGTSDKPPEKPAENVGQDLNGETSGSGNGDSNERVTGLIDEATALLKSINPRVKMVNVKRMGTVERPTGLLDGGATHALRRGTPQELELSDPVEVELAHGSIELRQHPITGTIFTDHAVEPIVPLRGLIELGFVIKWSSQGCEIRHPSRGTINCWLRNGCPVVSEGHALGLIQDIENMESAKKIPLGVHGPPSDEVYQWWTHHFPLVPQRIWKYMKGQGEEMEGLHVPWNRAQRRRHSAAKAIVIHLYAGEASKEWHEHWPSNMEMITLDVRDGQNIHDAATWAYLWRLCGSGKVIAIIGGPPCRTVSRMLEKRPGPPRLRSRTGVERFGLRGLTETQQQKTDSDSALFLKQLGLYIHAEASWTESKWKNMSQIPNRVGFLLESPQDPQTYLSDGSGDESASFWAWDETLNFLERFRMKGMEMIHFDQGVFGHCRKKPTSCMTNLPDMSQLDGCRSGEKERFLSEELNDRMNQTASWSIWAPGLRAAIRASLGVLMEWYGFCTPKVAAAGLGLEGWKTHIRQGHKPYRRDCRTCVTTMASSKPHRRREHAGSSAWTVAVDLVNLPKAKDLATGKMVKYGLVATALIPLLNETPEEKVDVDPNVEDWGEGLNEKEFPLDGQEDHEDGGPSEGCEQQPHGDDDMNLDDEGYVREEKPQSFDLEDPNIKERVKVMSEPIKVKHVTMMEPVETRNVHHVITAMDKILTRMQYLGVCVTRIHSDRAKELLASRFRSWIAHRNMLHSFTAGDDPQSNGHCESEVNQLKRRTRLLLHTAGQDSTHWPQAMRFATEERLRSQFESLGCPMPKMIQYQSRVLVKRKRWHDRGNLLAKPFVESRLLCPSPDMTFGWLVQTEVDQHVVHAREVIVPDPLSEQAQIELHEEPNPNKPPYRLWGKQSFPGRPRPKLPEPRFDRGGEPSVDLNQVHEELDELFAEKGIENPEGNPPNEVREGGMINLKRMENETVKRENWENVEKQLTWNHQRVMEHLSELLDVVPTSGEVGKHCGETVEWLNSQKQWLEWSLQNCKNAVDEKTVKLCGLQVSPGDDDNQGEILQTTTIPLSEVRKELGEWKEAMVREYNSLIHETKAIEPIDISQLNQEEIELVPGKLVTVRKAGPNGGKKKCRAVVCGNLLQGDADPNPGTLYASGADGVLIRAALAYSTQRGWGIGTTDIRTAFLLAPRPRSEGTREVIVIPPKVMVEAGVCDQGERWRVHHALYGFASSPAHWAVHRDKTLLGFQWTLDDEQYCLEKTEEGNFWKIIKKGDQNNPQTCEGHVIVYVDDIMALAGDKVRESFFQRLTQEWKCSEIETVDQTAWTRFCGFELRRHHDGVGLMVGQKSYTTELLKRHEGIVPRNYPIPKQEPVEEVETPSVDDVRRAQAVTGELLWIAVRSRPDISYAVSVMSRGVSKCPKRVQEIGDHVLGYLANTLGTCLVYHPCCRDHGKTGTLQVPRHERLLEAFADISFAPQGDKSHQGIIVCVGGSPIQWEASRQAFHTMSTAESELVGYCEAATMLKSTEALMMVVHDSPKDNEPFEKVVYGDNSSALSILTNPDGGWRTRHLRLRSSGLRELLKNDPQNWKIRHQRGTDLPADMLTKPIVTPKEWFKFWQFLGFHSDLEVSLGLEKRVPKDCVSPLSESMPISGTEEKPVDPEVESDETKEPMSKVAAIIGLAACAIGAGLTTSTRTRSGCALAAAACAGWLAGDAAAMSRHKGNVGKDGKKPRLKAIGKKKGQEVRENEPAHDQEFIVRENEPAMEQKGTIVRENEPTVEEQEKINKPGTESETESTLEFEKKKESLRAGIDGDPQNFDVPKGCREEGPRPLGLGCFQSRGKVQDSGEACHDVMEAQSSQTAESKQSARQGEAVFQHYCPTGCPIVPVETRIKAMSLRNGPMAGKSGASGYDASQGSASTSLLECNGPWNLPRFLVKPPTKSQDQWSFLEHEGKQYWIKTHHGPRERLFHPIHRSQPMEVQQLKEYRVTLMFPVEGKGPMMKKIDQWMDQHRVTGEKWVGYTFFEMKAKYQVDDRAEATPWVSEGTTTKGCGGRDTNKGKSCGGKQAVIEGPLVSIYVNQPMGSSTEHHGTGSGEGRVQGDQWPVTTGANEWGNNSDGWSMVSEMNEQ